MTFTHPLRDPIVGAPDISVSLNKMLFLHWAHHVGISSQSFRESRAAKGVNSIKIYYCVVISD